jgi:hypothetical protein
MVVEERYKAQGMGYYWDSGDVRDIAVCASGELIFCSGLYVVADVEVVASSGLIVEISGQHVFVESGVYLASGVHTVPNSGQVIDVGCAEIIRTADLVTFPANSGGESICVSGQWCSGNVHSVIIKSLSGNKDIFVGGSGCKPYSGHGFALAMQEAVTVDVCNPCIVYGYATHSGDRITWMGTDYPLG